MQDIFWTDEMIIEFVRFTKSKERDYAGYYSDLEQFKSSKSPKKEWEIMAFRVMSGNTPLFYRLKDNGRYYEDGYGHTEGWSQQQMLADSEAIHSVRRLSDGEVFSLGDRLKGFEKPIASIETGNWSDGLGFRMDKNNAIALYLATKLPAAILTTIDGKEIFPGDKCSFVFDDDWTRYFDADYDFWKPRFDIGWKETKAFSTREAAEAYVTENRPVLSLKDVKDEINKIDFPHYGTKKGLIDAVATLVKQKLNQ